MANILVYNWMRGRQVVENIQVIGRAAFDISHIGACAIFPPSRTFEANILKYSPSTFISSGRAAEAGTYAGAASATAHSADVNQIW